MGDNIGNPGLYVKGKLAIRCGLRPDDIVITADIPLASRCLKKGSHAIGTTGKPSTEGSIGQAVATRDLLSGLRETGGITRAARRHAEAAYRRVAMCLSR